MQTYSSTAKKTVKVVLWIVEAAFLTDDRPVLLLYWALQIYTDGSIVQIFINY